MKKDGFPSRSDIKRHCTSKLASTIEKARRREEPNQYPNQKRHVSTKDIMRTVAQTCVEHGKSQERYLRELGEKLDVYRTLMNGLIREGAEPIYIGDSVMEIVREAPGNLLESCDELPVLKGKVIGVRKEGEGKFRDSLVYRVATADGKEVDKNYSDLFIVYPSLTHYLMNSLLGVKSRR